jgi:hypothetical protein
MGRQGADRLAMGAILAVVVAYLGYGLVTASTSLGCDFLAYYNASVHWIQHGAIYDLATSSTGTCGTYQYPPPFVLLAAPFSFLGFDVGNWAWIAFLIGCWLIGTAILPVRSMTKATVLVLAAVGWPLVFGVRIGQVTPILYLVFAAAWRFLDRPIPLGASVAVGFLIKLQPVLLAATLVIQRRWRALAVAAITAAILATAAVVAGLSDWIGFLTLLRSLTNAVTVSTNVAIGATLHGLGLATGPAGTIQTLNIAVVALAVGFAAWRLPAEPAILGAIVATQLVSPIVWTHYALILLLPTAWLIERGHWWAIAIPLVHAWVLIPFVPIWTYTVAFYVAFIAVLVVGWRSREASGRTVRASTPSGSLVEPAA